MNKWMNVTQKVIPDLMEIMKRRYEILQQTSLMESVGRRSLATKVGMTERVLRGELDFLREQGLIIVDAQGTKLSEAGKHLLVDLHEVIKEWSGLNDKEINLTKMLQIEKVLLTYGDTDKDETVKSELGKEVARLVQAIANGGMTIAVTGGSTISTVAEALRKQQHMADVLFVPARGGVGTDMRFQANTLAARMAEESGGTYQTLYVPDVVGEEMYQSIIKEPEIKQVLKVIKKANIVIHGIGNALEMAERRGTHKGNIKELTESGAIAEAFGYYFNEEGKVVHRLQTVGLQLEDLQHADYVIAVAGGSTKAKAIAAYMKQAPRQTILVTDEIVAEELLKTIN
ncbi:sugar-binding transcriptional regulator [Cytobacillus sp. FSL R7-0680]|uniref:sugar-binding transcriptional regulator n=1 Tax=Cytobacillus sp. FSL R7-0680 TaxID=2921689 RepID=UPI0030F8A388